MAKTATGRAVSTISEKATAIASLLGGRTLSCAESCTAGQLTQAFAGVPKASEWLRGGLVAYQFEIKRRYLRVEAPSMFTEQCAEEMALGAANLFETDVAVSTTGVLGDEPEDGVEPGTVFIATLVSGNIDTNTHRFAEIGPAAIERVVEQALDDLLANLRIQRKRFVRASRG
jgi:nicotinamide-nucleotide amidase